MTASQDQDPTFQEPENQGDGIAPKPPRQRLFARLRGYLIGGILITAPISLTLYIAWQGIELADALFADWLPKTYNPQTYLPVDVPGFGLIIAIIFLTLVGFLSANYLGRFVVSLTHRLLTQTPIVRSIYGALKQVFDAVMSSSNSFNEVVLVEYPRREMWTLAFVTAPCTGEIRTSLAGKTTNTDGDSEAKYIGVYVPTTPNPTSGYFVYVPERDIIRLKMSVEEGIKLVISTGIVGTKDEGQKDLQKSSK